MSVRYAIPLYELNTKLPDELLLCFVGRNFTFQLTEATPLPLFVTAAAHPAT
jgi:hypothetical protein